MGIRIKHGRYVLERNGHLAIWDTRMKRGRVLFDAGRGDCIDLKIGPDTALIKRILTEGEWCPGSVEEV